MDLVELVASSPLWLSMLVLFLAAWIEYILPPFPGDTLMVAGGFFVAQGALPLELTFIILTLGSVSGCLVAWGLGYHGLGLRRLIKPGYLERIEKSYQHYGVWILIVNRFIPGVRGAFMLAAGLIKMPVKPILIWGTASALLWNSVLLSLGYLFSDSLERLLQIANAYGKSVLVVIGLFAIGWFLIKMGRLRSYTQPKGQTQTPKAEIPPKHL